MKHVWLLGLLWLLGTNGAAQTLTVTSATSDTRSGNLIVVLSPKKFRPHSPGLMNVYAGRLLVKTGVTLAPGGEVTFQLPEGVEKSWFAGAYLDENRNFMWRGLPDSDEVYTSEIDRVSKKDLRLVLDKTRTVSSPKPPPWMHEHTFVSSTLLDEGFSREESTLRFLVGLPPGYWTSDQTYPILYVTHGFNGNRWTYLKRFKMWREQMASKPMILVSLDSYGKHGHHLFLNSQTNGSRFDVFTKELIPYIDRRLRTKGRRVVYGQSSGGWTAISLLRRAPELIHAAVATGPDPLELDDWWMAENQNLYTNPDGSVRELVPTVHLSMKRFIEVELKTRSSGQFAGFLAAFSPSRPEEQGFPFESPFDLKTGALNENVWELWKENDMGHWARSHPTESREAFSNRLALFVGDKDEFGLYQTTRQFSETLKSLNIPHEYRVVEGAGHSDYLEEPEFVTECWSLFYELARRRIQTN
jgi:enterochelin esterase-like enzyme